MIEENPPAVPPRHVLLAAVILTALPPLYAQNLKEGTPLYKVEINFRDGNEAGATTDRHYTMLAMDSRRTVFKAGSKNPAVTETTQPQGGNPVASTQFTYVDVGVNIDCLLQAEGAKVAMKGSLDLSSITGDTTPVPGVRNPVIRQTKLSVDAVVELGKPTVLASIDDPLTARKLQVEATITRVN